MPRIFLSYRRADSITITGRIYDHLVRAFGEDQVFKDVDDIPLGVDFRNVLQGAVGGCDVVLVIIGPEWLTLRNKRGQPRIMDPDDFVHVEVAAGLARRDVLVVPVLINGTTMPSPADLPPALTELAYRNAAIMRDDPDFARDIQKLIEHITAQASPTRSRRKTPTPAPSQPVVSRDPTPTRDLTPAPRRRIRPLRWLLNLVVLAALVVGALWAVQNEDTVRELIDTGIAFINTLLSSDSPNHLACGEMVGGGVGPDQRIERWAIHAESGTRIFAFLSLPETDEPPPEMSMVLAAPDGTYIAYGERVDDLTWHLVRLVEETGQYTISVRLEDSRRETGYALELHCE